METTLIVNGYMWTRSFAFCGSRLDIETIKEDPSGHYNSMQ
jgi:hypothetical protein